MRHHQLNRLLGLIRRTGDRCVIMDGEDDEIFVLMNLPSYERMLDAGHEAIGRLSEQEMMKKVSRDITAWQASHEEGLSADKADDIFAGDHEDGADFVDLDRQGQGGEEPFMPEDAGISGSAGVDSGSGMKTVADNGRTNDDKVKNFLVGNDARSEDDMAEPVLEDFAGALSEVNGDKISGGLFQGDEVDLGGEELLDDVPAEEDTFLLEPV